MNDVHVAKSVIPRRLADEGSRSGVAHLHHEITQVAKAPIGMTTAPLLLALLALAAGCSHVEQSPSITETTKETATKSYWIDQPATDTVAHDDYDELWEAAADTARWRGFRVDRTDYRGGLLTTWPLASKQIFEPWKRDVLTMPDLAESTLASMRRIIRFEIARLDDGTFQCTPKVLVERYSSSERRITSVTQYRESFSIETEQGSKERDKGYDLPFTYWYTTGRDEALEKVLADGIRSRLRGAVARR